MMMRRQLNFEIDTELKTSLIAGIASLIEPYRLKGTAVIDERTVTIKKAQAA